MAPRGSVAGPASGSTEPGVAPAPAPRRPLRISDRERDQVGEDKDAGPGSAAQRPSFRSEGAQHRSPGLAEWAPTPAAHPSFGHIPLRAPGP